MFLTIVMIIPLHRFRIFVLRCFRMKIGKHCAICRNVDIRSPYRIENGQHCTVNKRVVLDGRAGEKIGKNEEIAQVLELSVETVKTQKKKAMYFLRERLGKSYCLLIVLNIISL